MNTPEQLTLLAKSEKDARKKIRLLAIAHFLSGHNRTQIAQMLMVSRRMTNKWVTNYLTNGLEGLEAKKPKGRRSYLSSTQQLALSRYIEMQSQNAEGGRLTGETIRQYVANEFNVEYHPNAIYKLLRKLGFSWITSRSRHPKQSQGVQDAYKKLPGVNDPSARH